MVKKDIEKLPRPEPQSPIANPSGGKIHVSVTGRLKYSSNDQRVVIERKK